MTDTLRFRIIAALLSEDDVALMADAVIAALGLRVEYGMAGQHDYSDNPEIHPVTKDEMERRIWYGEDWTFRYVTEWSAQ